MLLLEHIRYLHLCMHFPYVIITNAQLSGERATVEKLQGLLSSERQKEFQAHVSGQEKETEIQHLRQQLSRLEADRLLLNEQLRTLRSEVKLKGEEIQRLRAELSSEKFQREHARQQLASQRDQMTSSRLTITAQSQLTELASLTATPPPLGSTSGDPSLEANKPSTEDRERKSDDIFSQEREGVASDSARTSSYYGDVCAC